MKNSSYHFIFIPSDNRKTHRFRVSDGRFKLLAFGVVLSVSISLFAISGFWYYRNAYRELVSQRSEDLLFEQQKLSLISKIRQLELNVDRTERFADKLEAIVGSPTNELAKGIGPIPPVPQLFPQEGMTKAMVDAQVDLLEEKTASLERKINEVYENHQDRMIFLASMPSLWPVKGWLTSEFGLRNHPMHPGSETHEGIDVAAQWG
ncbi:MAG: hypothetical protein Q7S00_02200, partial [bacterium]|nr:hypothetical protein [bacterium]